jgi:AcrR family transcriptional regulator
MSARRTEASGEPSGLRVAQRRFTRQHILDAALEVFIDKGYVASTVEDIIERAGTSRRTFYAHFRSKTHVLLEIGADLVPGIQATYVELDQALLTGTWESMRAWIDTTMEWFLRYGALMPVWEEAAATDPEPGAQRQEAQRTYPDLMPHYLGRWPEERRAEARLRIVLLTLQLDRFFGEESPRDMEPAERAFIGDVLTNIWYQALQAPPNETSGS